MMSMTRKFAAQSNLSPLRLLVPGLAGILLGLGVLAVPLLAWAQNYADADIQIARLLKPLQYPMPITDHVHYNPDDGHFSFPNATGKEIDFAAAYKFCDHLAPVLPTPTHGGSRKITIDDIQSMNADRAAAAMKSAAVSECFDALAYRTACPQRASSALKIGTTATCYGDQVAVCQRLKGPADRDVASKASPRVLTGMNIDGIGDPEADAALANCETDGLSQAMQEKIMAYRCDSQGYLTGPLANIMADTLLFDQKIQFECPALKAEFDRKLDAQKQRLLTAIQNSILMGNRGGPANPAARPVQP